MNSNRMSYFITIAEVRNISKAAQILYVSQPSLTQYLNRLEKDLGVKLLDRSCTPIRLTEAGMLYLDYAKTATEAKKQFETRLEAYKKIQNQALTIGIPAQLLPLLFQQVVQGFLLDHPESKLVIREGTSLTVMDQLLKSEVDIAFFHTQTPRTPRFVSRIFKEEALFLTCNRESSIAAGRKGTRENPLVLSEADLSGMDDMLFLIPPKEYFINQVLLGYLKEIGLQPKKILEIPVLSAICDYIMEPKSNGISLLTNFSIRNLKNIDDITFLKIEGHDLTWHFTMNYLANTQLSELGYSFWKYASRKKL